jgi:acyl dehydratase
VNDLGLRYFEDYALGSTYECGSVSVDEASIIAFAKEFDPQPFHVDPVAARAGPFGGLVASGWHTAALVMRLLVGNYLSGDTLRVRATVVESRRSLSKPDRGIIKTMIEAANEDGRAVMRATAINFMLVGPAAGA